jgi:transcriptional regulator with GAF, ATPase, and Fis domain
VVTFFDISERRRAEDERRKSEDRKCTVLEINNAIIHNLTQEALFASVYEAIRGVVAFDRAAFLLYQSESKTLKLVSMDSDRESEFFRVGKEYQLQESQISAWVLEHQEVVTRGDLEQPRTIGEHRLVQEDIQSYCVVPLVAIGVSQGIDTTRPMRNCCAK